MKLKLVCAVKYCNIQFHSWLCENVLHKCACFTASVKEAITCRSCLHSYFQFLWCSGRNEVFHEKAKSGFEEFISRFRKTNDQLYPLDSQFSILLLLNECPKRMKSIVNEWLGANNFQPVQPSIMQPISLAPQRLEPGKIRLPNIGSV